MITSLWGGQAGVPLHTIHFGFTVGSLIGPFIVSAFLSDTPPTTGSDTPSNSSAENTHENVTASTDAVTSQTPAYPHDDSNIEYAYVICSICILAMAAIFFVLEFVRFPVKNSEIRKKSKSWKEILSPKQWALGNLTLGVLTILLLNAFYICHVGAVKGPAMLLTTYAIDSHLNFTASEAATLTSATGIGGAIARGLMIFVAGFISVNKLLILTVHGQLVSALILMYFGPKSKTNLWVCSFIFGAVVRPIWAAGYQWGNEYIIMVAFVFAMTRTVGRVADVGQNALQGYLYSNVAYESIFYTAAVYAVLHCFVLYAMLMLGRHYSSRHTRVPQDEQLGQEGQEHTKTRLDKK